MAMLRTGGEIMTTVMPGWWGHWAVKPAIQGKQEAATVLSLGLTTHIGLPTYREGRIEQNTLDTVSEIFRFIEERADYSRYGQLVTDVAVLHSYHTQLRHTAAFTVPPALEGAAKALHDTQIHYGIIGESALPADASEIKLLVLPEQQWLRDDDVEKIRNYVRSGGKVLATGTTSAGEGAIPALADVFGIECFGRACGSPWYVRPTATALISEFALNAPLMTPGEDVMLVKAAPPAEAWGRLLGPRRGSAFHFDEPDDDVDGWAGIIHHRFGRGEAVYVPAPLFDAFRKKNFFALRKLVRRLIDLLLPERMVVLDAPYALGVSLLRQNGRHVLHLVNHYTESTLADNTPTVVEHLPRLTDIAVTLRLNGEKPRSVTLQPEGRELSSHFHQGTLTFVVPEIHVHGCVVIEG